MSYRFRISVKVKGVEVFNEHCFGYLSKEILEMFRLDTSTLEEDEWSIKPTIFEIKSLDDLWNLRKAFQKAGIYSISQMNDEGILKELKPSEVGRDFSIFITSPTFSTIGSYAICFHKLFVEAIDTTKYSILKGDFEVTISAG